jgi:hypothetical protein
MIDQSRLRCALGLAVATAAAVGCGGSRMPTGPTAAPPAQAFQQHQSANFTFHFTPLDATTVAASARSVEAEHARILADLQLASMPSVSVFLHPDFASLQEAVRAVVGALPAFATGLVTGPTAIHVLSPNLSNTWTYTDGVTAIVHEFAHCVSWQINPSIPNNPRWLWETAAIYEARQFVHPRAVPWLSSGQPPSLSRLNGFDNTDIYAVGFLIGEFIVSRWGQAGLGALIRNNGNTVPITGLSEAAFLAAWYDHVRQVSPLASVTSSGLAGSRTRAAESLTLSP